MTGRPTKTQVNEELRHSYTPEGVKRWWDRTPPAGLNGRTPRQAWADGDYTQVLALAVAARSQEA